ncbi:MAG: hypothetical protein AAGP08_05860 [Pseudomonadota bacterium]
MSRKTCLWTVTGVLCFGALAEMVVDNQGAKPLRASTAIKAEAKPEDYL